MRVWIVFVGFLLALYPSLPVDAQPRENQDTIDCGDPNNADRRLRGCTALLNRANRLTARQRGEILLSRSYAQTALGNYRGAITDLNEALRLIPNGPDADAIRYYRAQAQVQLGEFDAAIAHFNNMIRRNPSDGIAFLQRGIAHRGRGNFEAAIADFNQSLDFGPFDDQALLNRGLTQRARGDLDAAIEDFDEAILLNPRYAIAFENRGLAHRDKGNLDAARSDLRRAVDLGSTAAQPHLDEVERRVADAPTRPAVQLARPTAPQPASPAIPQAAEHRVALVIGNGAYRAAGVVPLPNPVRDARAMAAVFRELGFQHVAMHQDLDQAGMLRALRDFEREAERADWAVVYFAGHGIEIAGTNHLVPVDAQLRSDRDVPDEAVALDRVLTRLEGAKKLRLVILDACRDNPFLPRMTRSASLTRSVTRGLAPIEDAQLPAGTLVAFAARAGQVAEDGSGENSPFVHSLQRRMREPNVEINLMFRRVRDDVVAATGRRQEPFTYASLPGEELFVRRQ